MHLESKHQQRRKHTWRRPGGGALRAGVRQRSGYPACRLVQHELAVCEAPSKARMPPMLGNRHGYLVKCPILSLLLRRHCYLHGPTDRQYGTPWAIRGIVTLSLEESLPREEATERREATCSGTTNWICARHLSVRLR